MAFTTGLDQLTPRERHVLVAMMAGRPAAEIARDNYVSLTTVRSQIRGILSKLGVNSQLAAVSLAFHAGWPSSAEESGNDALAVGM
jgi:two-component system, NarL family, nitrate/nitrite response regulator NarL